MLSPAFAGGPHFGILQLSLPSTVAAFLDQGGSLGEFGSVAEKAGAGEGDVGDMKVLAAAGAPVELAG